MKLHERVRVVQQAESSFGLSWLNLETKHEIDTYAALHLALNAIDKYWITADLRDSPVDEAVGGWAGYSLTQVPESLVPITQEAGSLLAEIVKTHDLTYGEIMMILAQQREKLAKCHIRAERHPNEPGEPGGEA